MGISEDAEKSVWHIGGWNKQKFIKKYKMSPGYYKLMVEKSVKPNPKAVKKSLMKTKKRKK